MLQWIHDRFKGVFAYVILIPLAVVFAAWGVAGLVTFTSEQRHGIKVDDQKVPAERIRREYQQQLAELQRAYRDEIPADVKTGLQESINSGFINQALLAGRTQERRFAITDADVIDSVRKIPAFQVGGTFNLEAYHSLLKREGYSSEQFEAEQREQLKVRQLQNSLMLSSFVTPAELRQAVALQSEQREVAFAVVPAARYSASVKPTPEQLHAYYDAHQTEYKSPETVTLQYVALRLGDMAAEVATSDDALRAYYDTVKDRYTTAEKRRARHILIAPDKDDAAALSKATALTAQIKAGADFGELARANSADKGSAAKGGDLDWAEKTFFVGPFADAVFGMQVGEVRGPVKTEFGYHIIKLDGIEPGKSKSFDEVRAELTAEYQRTEAERMFGDRQEQLDQVAFENQDSLEPVARKLKLKIQEIPAYTRASGGGELAANAKVLEAAFSPDVLGGQNSRAIEVGDGVVVVVRASDHKMPAQLPFEAVQAQLESAVRSQLASAQATATASAVAARLEMGTAWPAALQPAGAYVVATPDKKPAADVIAYRAAQFYPRGTTDLPAEVLTAAFKMQPPAGRVETQTVQLKNGDVAIFALTAVKPGEIVPAQRAMMSEPLQEAAGYADLQGYVGLMRTKAKITVDPTVFE